MDKKAHLGASAAAMLIGWFLLKTLGFGGMSPILAWTGVFAIGIGKEFLWDPFLRPKLGLGPKGSPDGGDILANGVGAGLSFIFVMAFGG